MLHHSAIFPSYNTDTSGLCDACFLPISEIDLKLEMFQIVPNRSDNVSADQKSNIRRKTIFFRKK